ncbi:MAG: tRNA-intron endonuclease, archaea type [Thermoplasmata archaeon]|nr:tRNA-intron endonuclease, archaea type [Thermoplasmata archaeon]
MAAVRGVVQSERVLVPDEKEANSLYNKGSFGVPQRGGALLLDLLEALYLVEADRLRVEGQDAAGLLRYASAREAAFENRFIVYRDLRARTFAVKRASDHDFHLYPRGALPGKSASSHLVRCAAERDAFDAPGVLAELDAAKRAGKKLLLALVDEEGDLTYYDVAEPELRAKVPALPAARARAVLLDDRVMALGRDDAAMLFGEGYFGRDVGVGLQLSLPEALYLAQADRLALEDVAGAPLPSEKLAKRAAELEPDFALRHRLYAHLRRQGVVVKTGFKYGTHFRAYVGAPEEEHAPYLVHALAEGRRLPWPEIAGFVRLAHGVRKRLFFAVPSGETFRLLELARTRP